VKASFRNWARWFPTLFVLACAGSRAPSPGTSTTTPNQSGVRPSTIPGSPGGPWSFSFSTGIHAYRISRTALITSGSDLATHQEASSNITHEVLTTEPSGEGEGISFRAVVDTFTLATQGLIGAAQPVQLPIRLSGTFSAAGLTINERDSVGSCNPINSIITTDLYNLLESFPSQLSRGMTWRDSAETKGCHGAIPTMTQTVSTFVVSAGITYEGEPLLAVQRIDTSRARGEGAQGQHRIAIEGTGTGSALYYLNSTSGGIVRLTTDHSIRISITASGRVYPFTQNLKQEFVLVR